MYIEAVDLSGFKSFKKAHVVFSPAVNAIVGPNGSGKSNICDAILFALGEGSKKRLRVDTLKKLLHPGYTKASVTLTLRDGDKRYRITRTVASNGKITYSKDGINILLKDLKEFLHRKNMGNVKSSIIPQGEIDKIVHMKPADRKIYIDELADTAIYEMKKAEAMRELEAVSARIDEANLIIGEKLRILRDLEKEMEQAKKYRNLEERRRDLKASILKKQLDDVGRMLSRQESQKAQLEAELKEWQAKLQDVEERVKELAEERAKLDEKLLAIKERDELFKKAEALKGEEKVIAVQTKELTDQRIRAEEELKTIEEELAEKVKKLDHLKEESNIKLEEVKEMKELSAIDAAIESLEKQIAELEEKKANVEKELEKFSALASPEEESTDVERELSLINTKTTQLFSREKTLNERLRKVDSKLIDLREKYAVLRASVSTSQGSTYLLIDELRKSGKVQGIFGRVIDLIEFSSSLAEAVDAAGGSRLAYIVVDNVDTAKTIISYLRKAEAGKATFIPLDAIKSTAEPTKGELPLMTDMIQYDPAFEKAIKFVFGDTVLAKDFDDANRHKGKFRRIVTLKGEVFESSGIISGGKSKSSLASSKMVETVRQEMDTLREEKAAILNELTSIREELSSLRAERARLQAMKTERDKIIKQAGGESSSSIKEKLSQLKAELKGIVPKLDMLRGELTKKKVKRKSLEAKVQDKIAAFASKKERIKAKQEMALALEREIEKLRVKREELAKHISSLISRERTLRDKKNIISAKLVDLEETLSKKYKEIEAVTDRIKAIERDMQSLGGEKAKAEKEIGRIDKSLRNLEVSLASLKERFSTLSEEFSKMGFSLNGLNMSNSRDNPNNTPSTLSTQSSSLASSSSSPAATQAFNFIDEPLSKLKKELEDIEKLMAGMQNINFAAEDTYERIEQELAGVKDKLEKLKQEKEAVLHMMVEIEKKKKDAFLAAFEKLNKKFKEMFGFIKDFGVGELVLENAKDIDKAKLHIRVIREGKEVYIDSLAGGEKTLVSLFFLYALNAVKPSAFYIFDEVDAALDKLNSDRMAEFIRNLSKQSQFIIVSHKENVASKADVIIGVSKQRGASRFVEIRVPDDVKRKAEGKPEGRDEDDKEKDEDSKNKEATRGKEEDKGSATSSST